MKKKYKDMISPMSQGEARRAGYVVVTPHLDLERNIDIRYLEKQLTGYEGKETALIKMGGRSALALWVKRDEYSPRVTDPNRVKTNNKPTDQYDCEETIQ